MELTKRNYKVRVWLDPTVSRELVYEGRKFFLKNKGDAEVFVDLISPSVSNYNTFNWENDMIDTVLDSLEGTDMKMISRVEY